MSLSSYLNAQISPGELSKAHSKMEGMGNCTKCHDLGNQVSDMKCLDCHKEIRQLISEKRGYHSSSEVMKKNCRNCHSEHFGRDFKLIRFDVKKFDHSVTKFSLTGAHSKTECIKCHTDQIQQKLNRKNKTYLGLSADCSSCHNDIHVGTLGNNCAACHSTNFFKPAEFFDHNKSKFRLLQAHTKVSCEKCHQKVMKNGRSFQKFKGLTFTNCFPCHNDIHNNKFGKDCKSCHIVAGFHFVNKNAFDHNRTSFPLLGKHSSVDCNLCHTAGISIKPAFANCADCHKDYHAGEFVSNRITLDCSICHTVYGFSPSIYKVEDHQKSTFPLEGRHLAVECSQCHYKENKWQFRIQHNECTDCHMNIHQNEISLKISEAKSCLTCHNSNGWNKINFEHSLTGYKLSGKHLSLSCLKCHVNENTNKVYFKKLNTNCQSCHIDHHNEQFGKTSCEDCHSTNNWEPVFFDHNQTRFKLDGKHELIACIKCHPKVISNGKEYVRYKQENIKCSACHS